MILVVYLGQGMFHPVWQFYFWPKSSFFREVS